jgi:hypothetical protein
MTTSKYTPEQIREITERILQLRMRWLRSVEAKIASHQKSESPEHPTAENEISE